MLLCWYWNSNPISYSLTADDLTVDIRGLLCLGQIWQQRSSFCNHILYIHIVTFAYLLSSYTELSKRAGERSKKPRKAECSVFPFSYLSTVVWLSSWSWFSLYSGFSVTGFVILPRIPSPCSIANLISSYKTKQNPPHTVIMCCWFFKQTL